MRQGAGRSAYRNFVHFGVMIQDRKRLIHTLEPVIAGSQGVLVTGIGTLHPGRCLKFFQLAVQLFARGQGVSLEDQGVQQ
jgi:hypothetical protein